MKAARPKSRKFSNRPARIAARSAARRAKNWADSPLGEPAGWPQSLKTVVRIMLTSRYAMWMAWGPELTFLHNDAYRPTLGIKDAWALGARARDGADPHRGHAAR